MVPLRCRLCHVTYVLLNYLATPILSPFLFVRIFMLGSFVGEKREMITQRWQKWDKMLHEQTQKRKQKKETFFPSLSNMSLSPTSPHNPKIGAKILLKTYPPPFFPPISQIETSVLFCFVFFSFHGIWEEIFPKRERKGCAKWTDRKTPWKKKKSYFGKKV